MKWNPRLNDKSLATSCAAILLAFASVVACAGTDGDAIAQTSGNVPYVSGGVGEESINRLTSLAGDFNLKLVFALKSGAYLSGVRVAVVDRTGKTLVDATSEGPWFMVRLPVGDYQISAALAGTVLAQKVTLDGKRLTTIDFRWDSE